MVMLVWTLDLQLSMQSVPINTKVVSLNPAHVTVFLLISATVHPSFIFLKIYFGSFAMPIYI
jgi:hypothetical protein